MVGDVAWLISSYCEARIEKGFILFFPVDRDLDESKKGFVSFVVGGGVW